MWDKIWIMVYINIFNNIWTFTRQTVTLLKILVQMFFEFFGLVSYIRSGKIYTIWFYEWKNESQNRALILTIIRQIDILFNLCDILKVNFIERQSKKYLIHNSCFKLMSIFTSLRPVRNVTEEEEEEEEGIALYYLFFLFLSLPSSICWKSSSFNKYPRTPNTGKFES